MGLFSSIFGSAGSDKADKLRQQAIDAFNSIKTPELSALQVQLQQYVLAGQLTPDQAEASLLNSNAFNAIKTDPANNGAQKMALQQLQDVATQGGMTAIDKARMQDITDQLNQENKSTNAAMMQQEQQRGVGNSDLAAVNAAINEQGAADRAARSGVDVAANAQQRALQAMQAAGSLGTTIESQQYGEQANKAQAQNAIDLFNKQALNQTNLYDVQASNAAKAANLANAQAVANANTQTANANKEYNAGQNQTVFEDQLRKAQGIAGVDTNAAEAAAKQAEQERNASAGLISGALQAGGTAVAGAFGGPPAAIAANSAMSGMTKNSPTSESELPGGGGYNPNAYTDENQFFEGGQITPDHPEHPDHMAMGGHVHCYAYGGESHHHPDCYMAKKGGKVPGKAQVAGDSPKNDTVDAKLSPGEIVVPRSAANDDEEFNQFMEKFRPSNRPKLASGGLIPPAIPRVMDSNPMRNTVRSPAADSVPLAATNDANDYKQFLTKFKTPKKVKPPTHIPLEAKALANLHGRVTNLEGGKV